MGFLIQQLGYSKTLEDADKTSLLHDILSSLAYGNHITASSSTVPFC